MKTAYSLQTGEGWSMSPVFPYNCYSGPGAIGGRILIKDLTSDSSVFVYLLFIKADLPTHSHNRIANLHAGDLCSFLSTLSVEGKDYGARYVF